MASPSDMARDKKTLAEAYYLSNVCPMNKSLYDMHWTALCKRTRNFIKSGTGVWIIAGPVFGEKSQKIGPGKVYVPEYFYRIALFQAKDYSFRAIAFLLPNREAQGILKKYVVSIDEVEKSTGLNFFDKLPEEVQSALESKPANPAWVEKFLES
jgi:endonuclease G, mitochondrial